MADTDTPFDVKVLKQLIKLMGDNDITDLELVSGEQKIKLAKTPPTVAAVPAVLPASPPPAPAAAPASAPAGEAAADSSAGLLEIKSPMVGTFYRAPSPDQPAFAKEGDQVGQDTVVCIIEAMKVFNEIQAEVSGKIKQVLVENGKPVEFGQVLFLVEP